MNRLLYFAYGSNMLNSRINDRFFTPCVYVRNYVLRGYKLVFNGGNGFYANIEKVEDPASFVEGCLYELDDKQISKLDMCEGYPWTYQKFYTIDNQDVIFGYVCQKNPWDINGKQEGAPFVNYLNYLIEGCIEKGLEHTFNYLINFKNVNYDLKKKKKYKMNKNDEILRLHKKGSKDKSFLGR